MFCWVSVFLFRVRYGYATSRWWIDGFKNFLFSPLLGEMIQLTYIFQMGSNHRLEHWTWYYGNIWNMDVVSLVLLYVPTMQTASFPPFAATKPGETFHEAHSDGLDTSWDSPAGHWDPPRGKEGWNYMGFDWYTPEKLTWHLENTAWKGSFPFEMAPFLKGDMSVFAGVNVNEWWFQKIRSLSY